MQYHAALSLYKSGAKLRNLEEYEKIARAVFDVPKFLQYLLEKAEVQDVTIFYKPISTNRE